MNAITAAFFEVYVVPLLEELKRKNDELKKKDAELKKKDAELKQIDLKMNKIKEE